MSARDCEESGEVDGETERENDDWRGSHNSLRRKYGTLNPAHQLSVSDLFEGYVDQLQSLTRAREATITRVEGGSDHGVGEVNVEFTFSPDDFPEVFDRGEIARGRNELTVVRLWGEFGGHRTEDEPNWVLPLRDGKPHMWSNDPRAEYSMDIDIIPADTPATLHIYTSNAVEAPTFETDGSIDQEYWGEPVETLEFSPGDNERFHCQLSGRVMFYVENS